MTSQCSTIIPFSMRRMSAAIQFTGWPKPENIWLELVGGRRVSPCCVAAVDGEGLARDEGRLVRTDEHDGVGDLFGVGGALQKVVGCNGLLHFLAAAKAVEHAGLGRADRDGVNPYAEARGFHCRRLRQALDRVL